MIWIYLIIWFVIMLLLNAIAFIWSACHNKDTLDDIPMGLNTIITFVSYLALMVLLALNTNFFQDLWRFVSVSK